MDRRVKQQAKRARGYSIRMLSVAAEDERDIDRQAQKIYCSPKYITL